MQALGPERQARMMIETAEAKFGRRVTDDEILAAARAYTALAIAMTNLLEQRDREKN